jgi:hypothetical protein
LVESGSHLNQKMLSRLKENKERERGNRTYGQSIDGLLMIGISSHRAHSTSRERSHQLFAPPLRLDRVCGINAAWCSCWCLEMATSRALVCSLLNLFLLVVPLLACNYADCVQDAMQHEGDWVKCDDCVCNDFNNIADDDGGSCEIHDKDVYQCWILQDIDDGTVTWSCMPRMKTAWIIGFVFISLFGCCCIAGLCSYFCKPKRNEEVRVVLVHSQI